MRIVKGILVVFMCLLAGLFFSTDFSAGGIIMLVLAVVVFFFMPTKSSMIKREDYLKSIDAVEIFRGRHVAGLPIGEAACTITFFKDNLCVDGGGGKYNISIEKLRDVQVKQDVEIQQEVTSSFAKGVAGGLLFGPAGAIIGSRAKTKKQKEVTLYLIINYLNKENQMESICFDTGTYSNSGIDMVSVAQSETRRQLKNVRELISKQEYVVDL